MRPTLGASTVAYVVMAGAASASPVAGVYSNVCLSRVTGDQGGLELALIWSESGQPAVVFKICEGGCWTAPVHELTVRDNGISFTAENKMFGEHGRPLPSEFVRFSGTFGDRSLKLDGAGYWKDQRLVRQKGYLAAGPGGTEWPIPVKVCR